MNPTYAFTESQIHTANWILSKMNEYGVREVPIHEYSHVSLIEPILQDFILSTPASYVDPKRISRELSIYTHTSSSLSTRPKKEGLFRFLYNLKWRRMRAKDPVNILGRSDGCIDVKSIMEIASTGFMASDVRMAVKVENNSNVAKVISLFIDLADEYEIVKVNERNGRKVFDFISFLIDEYSLSLREELSSLSVIIEQMEESTVSERAIKKAKENFIQLLSIPILEVMKLTLTPDSTLSRASLMDPKLIENVVGDAKRSYEEKSIAKKIAHEVDKADKQ